MGMLHQYQNTFCTRVLHPKSCKSFDNTNANLAKCFDVKLTQCFSHVQFYNLPLDESIGNTTQTLTFGIHFLKNIIKIQEIQEQSDKDYQKFQIKISPIKRILMRNVVPFVLNP
jgi:hypothetical protein